MSKLPRQMDPIGLYPPSYSTMERGLVSFLHSFIHSLHQHVMGVYSRAVSERDPGRTVENAPVSAPRELPAQWREGQAKGVHAQLDECCDRSRYVGPEQAK